MGVRIEGDTNDRDLLGLVTIIILAAMLGVVVLMGLGIRDHDAKMERIADEKVQVARDEAALHARQGWEIVERCGE